MFTLELTYYEGGTWSRRAFETVTSGHIPQLGSTINSDGIRSGTWKVVHIGQSVGGGVMSNTIHVHLEETG